MRVLGIAGSLRSGSHAGRLLEVAGSSLPDGAELDVFGGLGAVPPYDADVEAAGPMPAGVEALRTAIASSDGVLVVTPEYNGSVPGVLKNAIDWASRPVGEAALTGKPVAIVSHSPGQFGGLWAAEDLKRILGIAGAKVVEEMVSVPEVDLLLPDDAVRLSDEEIATRLDALAGAIAREASAAAAPVGAR